MAYKALSKIKIKVSLKPVVENLVFRLHYRYTHLLYLACVLLTTLYDMVGKKISCMTGISSSSFNDAVNNYCFIMGTFTVDRLNEAHVGVEAPHPGVGPQQPGDTVTYHTYYQWVPFVLFMQAVVFYVPHWLWKSWEGGLFRSLIQDLSVRDYLGSKLKTYFKRENMIQSLSKYLSHHREQHGDWAYKFFFCELLNLVVVVATLFFTDWFLGGEFLTYGTRVIDLAGVEPENRTDPMSYVFPKMAKCTFRLYGASGTVQIRDILCLIATNIINEKIFIFLWVWLVLLTAVTSAWILYRLLIILLPRLRLLVLKSYVRPESQRQVEAVLAMSSLSHWFLLVSLARNMERTVFSEFIHALATEGEEGDAEPLQEFKQSLPS